MSLRFAALITIVFLFPLHSRAIVCAYPIVVEAGITDIHENEVNGPFGFAYIVNPKGAKAGKIPLSIGGEDFDSEIFASNFQGPHYVKGPKLKQFEWTARNWLEVSKRIYPLVFQHRCVDHENDLKLSTVQVKEHDDFGMPDDKMGAFDIDLGQCREIFSVSDYGWSSKQISQGKKFDKKGPASISYVAYKLWCYRCEGDTDCAFGIR